MVTTNTNGTTASVSKSIMQKAQESVKKLFKSLNIGRVVCVDDQYDQQPSFAKFKTLYEQTTIEELQTIPELNPIIFIDPDIVREKDIEALWENFSDDDKKRVFVQLLTKVNSNTDHGYAETLHALLNSFDFKELSLAQWRKRKPQILREAKRTKTLFLFDQDFSKEGGSSHEGIRLIEDILTSEERDIIMCGLLSHTFAPEQEHEQLNEYIKNQEGNRDKFIFISKQQLHKDPLEFVRLIKLTALSPKCKELKEVVAGIIGQAHDEAKSKVNLIDIYDFEHIIFQTSLLEGVWEPDTLFRLFGLYQRSIARELARSKDELHEIAADIRPISTVSTHSTEAPKHRSWEVQRLEIYEDETYINYLHMPVELGDIFDVILPNETKKFILLAQPCDLMIRPKGKRKQTVTEIILAEIIDSETIGRRNIDGKPLDQDAFFELPYFTENGHEKYVSFQKRHSVKLLIIDLCAYQDDGYAYLNVKADCPKYVIPTWQDRYKKLVIEAKELFEQYQQIYGYCSKLPPAEAEHVLGFAKARILSVPLVSLPGTKENLFTGEINLDDWSIRYNLKRSGRLCQSHSTALLAKFAAFLARNAFEHDFGVEN
ncbi:hypothetical protein KSC_086610 [Ktedonobacter sp. SOSP1-52]|uniref:hypothetical protein n=1 Tax=Ktedonobacter sp. SOSP1-52 TaxID=2778366 RepID=UPI0019159C5E|nr:hypothetical protein [Ktedonobacter sp. SOSP1-52]GHO69769.1 hypothetical protein KSC_086610 [Ktedonobacter sp. SOSP1-52]